MLCFQSTNMAACVVSNHVVFLDLPHDRYFCLEPRLESAALAILRRTAELDTSSSEFATTQVLRSERFLPVKVEAITESAIDSALPQPPARSVAEALFSNARTLIELKFFSLSKSIERVRQGAGTHGPVKGRKNEPLPAILAAHLASHRLLSAHNRCLPLSIGLAKRLRNERHAVDLVIGVRMAPFAAHAWVQQGNVVLNDDLDHVRAFQPILVA